MKKIIALCLSFMALAVAVEAQTRTGKRPKVEQAAPPAPATNNSDTKVETQGRPAKESKESQEDAAANDNNGNNGGGDRVQKMLGLTAEQNAQFKAIVAELRTAIKAVRSDASVSGKDKKAKVQQLNSERDSKLKTIFTPEQFAKWVEMGKNKMGGKGKGGPKGNMKGESRTDH